jgi:predicted  nucleic acid-binding Zn-ribbon protein
MKKTCAVVLAISMAILLAGGCQDEQASSDVRQSRLAAVENRELKTQCQQETKKRDEEIKNLNTQMQTEKKKRDDKIEDLKTQLENLKKQLQAEAKKGDDKIKDLAEQLSQCKKANDAKIEEIQKDMRERNIAFITELVNKNSELTTEVERLKAELAKAKGEK